MDQFWREAALIAKIRPHSNIVQFFGVCLDPLCLVTEFMEGGDLKSYLDNIANKIEQDQMLKWFQQIGLGK